MNKWAMCLAKRSGRPKDVGILCKRRVARRSKNLTVVFQALIDALVDQEIRIVIFRSIDPIFRKIRVYTVVARLWDDEATVIQWLGIMIS
jgi:hypothetical protein